MSGWDRTNRLELELLQAHRAHLEDIISIGALIRERDQARDLAVRLEQELAAVTSTVALVPMRGDAS